VAVPKTRTPRELLLTALERRRLTGFRASPDAAWVMFDPAEDGGTTLEVIHLPRVNRFRVVSSQTTGIVAASATTLGNFRNSEDAAACIEDALASDAGDRVSYRNGFLAN
jgi:hypothetical protein